MSGYSEPILTHQIPDSLGKLEEVVSMEEVSNMKESILTNRDYTLIIDKSGSMGTTDCAGGKSRWTAARESTEAVARKVDTLDPDGMTLYVFSGSHKRYENVKADAVAKCFGEHEPMGGTNLAGVLEHAFADFKSRKAAGKLKENGETIVVVTDGEPDSAKAVETAIVNISKILDKDEELAILFLQIGKDEGAKAFLQLLDDDLKDAKFDIVDTKTFEQLENMTITEALLEAISG